MWGGEGGGLTACCAMVADDREEVVGCDLGLALLSKERTQVKSLEGEGDVAADFERVHDLVPEALQVDAQDLEGGEEEAVTPGRDARGPVTRWGLGAGLWDTHWPLFDPLRARPPGEHKKPNAKSLPEAQAG